MNKGHQKALNNFVCSVVQIAVITEPSYIVVVKPYQPAWKALVQNFGRHILLPNEEIDREKLGKIVFGDDAKRRVLNKCTHPAVYSSIWWALLKYFVKGEKFVILDLPLLYESGVSLFLLKDVIVVYW